MRIPTCFAQTAEKYGVTIAFKKFIYDGLAMLYDIGPIEVYVMFIMKLPSANIVDDHSPFLDLFVFPLVFGPY